MADRSFITATKIGRDPLTQPAGSSGSSSQGRLDNTCGISASPTSRKDEEKAANLFAGAFLVPREHLLREVGRNRSAPGYKEIVDLKRLYRISGAALPMRLRQLDVIDRSTLVYAFQTIARGWRTQEPEEPEEPDIRGKRERARRFERLCYRALAEGMLT